MAQKTKLQTATPPAAVRDTVTSASTLPRPEADLGPSALICSTNPGDRLLELGALTCRDSFEMHPTLEPEKLHRIEYVIHPLRGVDSAVDVVTAVDCGGRVVAVA